MSERHSELVRIPMPAAGSLQFYLSYQDEPTERALVYVHGFGSTRTGLKGVALEEACARRDWTFASFDFRGHGQSTGTLVEMTGSGLLEDLVAVRDYLVGRGVPRLCLVGSSMGGWAAAWFAMRHPDSVPGCVLLAPALDFLHKRTASLTVEELARWKDTGRLRVKSAWLDVEIGYGVAAEADAFPPQRLEAGLSRPTLILHGMQDADVPHAGSLAFIERAAFPEIELRLFKDGDHRLLDRRHEIAEAACDFFARIG